MKALLLLVTTLVLGSCGSEAADTTADSACSEASRPPAGSNEVLRAPVASAAGMEVIVSDVVIPPDAVVPRHYHPGEEFLYVIDGSAIHVEEGKPDRPLSAGDAWVIPPRAVHAPRGGPCGTRAIVFRVHVAGEEERVLVPE